MRGGGCSFLLHSEAVALIAQRMRLVAPARREDIFFCLSVLMIAEVKTLILIYIWPILPDSFSLRTYPALVKLFSQFNIPLDIQ